MNMQLMYYPLVILVLSFGDTFVTCGIADPEGLRSRRDASALNEDNVKMEGIADNYSNDNDAFLAKFLSKFPTEDDVHMSPAIISNPRPYKSSEHTKPESRTDVITAVTSVSVLYSIGSTLANILVNKKILLFSVFSVLLSTFGLAFSYKQDFRDAKQFVHSIDSYVDSLFGVIDWNGWLGGDDTDNTSVEDQLKENISEVDRNDKGVASKVFDDMVNNVRNNLFRNTSLPLGDIILTFGDILASVQEET